ncbi:MAG: Rid family hydrolase, partial [Hyphomicrobiales bacterium]
TMVMPDDVGDQTRNILETISAVLERAGFSMSDIVRANIIITDAAYADIAFPVLGQTFREILPAATMIIAGLVKPEMKIEIEVTAKRSD